MDFRIKIALALGSLALLVGLALGACTDSPAMSGNGGDDSGQCDAGFEFDEEQEECVAVSGNGGNDENDWVNAPDDLAPWADESGDGVPNRYDNCPYHHNPDQTDTSGDGVGDKCDNCPELANPDQAYSEDNPVDDRGIIMGDACVPGGEDNEYADLTTDSSGDGVPDIMDNCPDHYNPPLESGCECPADDVYCVDCLCTCPDGVYPCDGCAQRDSSGDGVGDKCDNCPHTYNPEQASTPGSPTWQEHSTEEGDCDNRDCTIRMGDSCVPEPYDVGICDVQDTEFARMDPNVYISLDLSGSMGTTDTDSGLTRMQEALNGLDIIADDLANQIRFGLGTFPDDAAGSCTTSHVLDIDAYSNSALKSTWSDYSEGGLTPMYDALADIRDNDRLTDSSDPNDDDRVKAVLLITDGVPNCDPYDDTGQSAVDNVAGVIADLYDDDGILTFVVGFHIDDPSLAQFATAGGTDEHFLADDADELSDAMTEVADLLVSCDYSLDTVPEEPEQLWISVDGDYLDADEYSYDESANILTLEEQACEQVRNIDADQVEVEIEMGCASACVAEEPAGLCDMWHETCGEGYACDSCSPEICDGTDNNCSGRIDDNCPTCSIYQNPCSSTADCCEPFVCTDDGVCGHECYPDSAPCTSDRQCCSGLCGIASGDDVGSCISP